MSPDAPRPAGGPPGNTPADATFELLARAHGGDHDALNHLFARYLPRLHRWASGRLPRWARDAMETQDLVQETLLQTFKQIGNFEPQREGAFQAYLRQAVMNRIRDELRKFARRPAAADADAVPLRSAEPSPLESAIGSEAFERYEAALQRLRSIDREAIIARVEMECTYEEMAAMLEMPSAEAARKTAQRALVKLAQEMNTP
jgi:RNA polymerase sigma factor (sigma-70 family)